MLLWMLGARLEVSVKRVALAARQLGKAILSYLGHQFLQFSVARWNTSDGIAQTSRPVGWAPSRSICSNWASL